MNEITVSIICLTYNHANFIKNALEGFVNQITNFEYEILIHDDCSTDGTAEIIRTYETKYPNLIKPIYQKENIYSKHIPIIPTQVLPRAKGQYIAFCEGDDFWIDNYKLQKQVDVMEEFNSCSICFNTIIMGDIEGKSKGIVLPPISCNIEPGKIESKILLSLIAYPGPFHHLFIQLSGCMFRTKFFKDYFFENPIFVRKFDVGDIPLFLYMATKGDGYYIGDKMSVYRTENPNSWVGNMEKTKESKIHHMQREIEGLRAFDKYSNYIIHREVLNAIKNRNFYQIRATHDVKSMKAPPMQELYDLLPLVAKIKEHILYFFPFVEDLWIKIKRYKGIKYLRRWVSNCQEQKITKRQK